MELLCKFHVLFLVTLLLLGTCCRANKGEAETSCCSIVSVGNSLLETESLHNVTVGRSLNMDLTLGDSLIDGDVTLGKSLDDISILDESFLLETSLNETEWTGLLSSTPQKKMKTPEYLEKCYTTPKPISNDKLMLAETSPGDKKLLKKFTGAASVLEAVKSDCFCGKKCLQKYTYRSVRTLRYRFWSKNRSMRAQWLIQTLKLGNRNGRHMELQTDDGIHVCSNAFHKLYKLNKNYMVTCRKLAKRQAVATGARKSKLTSQAAIRCIAWFEKYATCSADRMPDSNTVLLPYKTTKLTVYETYKKEHIEGPVSRSTFNNIWKWHFPNVKIKQTNSFTICNICATLNRKLENEVNADERAKYMRWRIAHNNRQMLERIYYYGKREESRKNPSQYLSLIIDGMDQSKSSLPHLTGRRAKVINPADLLKTHITGVISHGHNEFSTYLDYNQYPHDPNLTLNILLKTLMEIAKREDNQLPPVLYLQADNCYRENKNKYVLAFCELLVMEKIFDEVHISFLFVGHTHEDVDSCFSQISQKLKKNDAETLTALKQLLPKPTDLDNMLDIKTWLLPSLRKVEHHTAPHHYRFSRSGDKVCGHYKCQQHKVWEQLTDSFFIWTPKRKPSVLHPDTDHLDLDKLWTQITNMRYLFKDENSVLRWWKSFIDGLKQRKRRKVTVKFLEALPRQKTKETSQPRTVTLPPEIQKLVDKETESQVVIMRKPRGNQNSRTQKKQNRQQTQGSKSNSNGGRRRTVMVTREKTVLIPLNDEIKRHFWFMILCALVYDILDYCVLAIYFILFVEFLRTCNDLLYFIFYLHVLWINTLKTHLGHGVAMVCLPHLNIPAII